VLEDCRSLRIFYDLDAPVTLSRIALGEDVGFVAPDGYSGFDLVLSYTGGKSVRRTDSGYGREARACSLWQRGSGRAQSGRAGWLLSLRGFLYGNLLP
jgi:hypothetical protein